MDYFILEQVKNFEGAAAQKMGKADGSELYKTSKIADLQAIDFIEKDFLISDRLKQLFEKYLPYNKWEMRVFLDLGKAQAELKKMGHGTGNSANSTKKDGLAGVSEGLQAVFWKLEAEVYIPSEQGVFDENGILQDLCISEMPDRPIFKIILPENTRSKSFSIVVHLSVAESILRRKYLGVNLIRL